MEKEFKEKFHNCYPSVRVIHCEAQVYRDARSSVINLLSGITAYVYAFNEYHPHGLWREYSSKRRLDDKKLFFPSNEWRKNFQKNVEEKKNYDLISKTTSINVRREQHFSLDETNGTESSTDSLIFRRDFANVYIYIPCRHSVEYLRS